MHSFRDRFRALTRRVRALTTRHRVDLDMLLNGYRGTCLLYVAVKLRIPDLLGDVARDASELAALTNANPDSLRRFLRALVVIGICAEDSARRFRLTKPGMRLRSSAHGAARDQALLAGEEYAPAWINLLDSVKSGTPAFDRVFGQTPWQHRHKHPELSAAFVACMDRGTIRTGRALIDAYDFSGCKCIADVGGGTGALLIAILTVHPNLRGLVIDQPHLADAARSSMTSAGVAARCEFVGSDLFDMIPGGADVYVMKSVLHDWNDVQCAAILRTCGAALSPGQRLLIIEKTLPECVTEDPSVFMTDLHMLAVTGGRERSLSELNSLLGAAGFAPRQTTQLGSGHTLLETVRG